MAKLYKKGVVVWRAARARLKRTVTGRSRLRLFADATMLGGLGCLALASAAAVASAWSPAFETFGNLQGHIAAACAVMVLAALLIRSNRWAFVAVLALAVNIVSISIRLAPVTTCPVQTAAAGRHVVRILTHNIWGGNRDLGAIERMLVQQRPDVVVLQELRPHHSPLFERLRPQYPFQAICEMNVDCGIAVLSRFPLEPRREIGGDEVMAMETVITVEDHELVLLSAHMARPFEGRAQSVKFQALSRVVSGLPTNAMVAGDFNSVPWSANMARYVGASGVCASNATHATWPRWLGPFGVPIDHIFLKPGVRLLSIATLDGTGSDHRALLATVDIR